MAKNVICIQVSRGYGKQKHVNHARTIKSIPKRKKQTDRLQNAKMPESMRFLSAQTIFDVEKHEASKLIYLFHLLLI